jgi:hypothetical protein
MVVIIQIMVLWDVMSGNSLLLHFYTVQRLHVPSWRHIVVTHGLHLHSRASTKRMNIARSYKGPEKVYQTKRRQASGDGIIPHL